MSGGGVGFLIALAVHASASACFSPFFYLAEYDTGAPGQQVAVRTLLYSEQIVQRSLETTGSELKLLEECEADIASFVIMVTKEWKSLCSLQNGSQPETSLMGSQLELWLCLSDEKSLYWHMSSSGMPPLLAYIVDEFKKPRPAFIYKRVKVARIFIRARLLTPEAILQFESSRLFHRLDPARVKAESDLEAAILHPFQLIAVRPGTNPYSAVRAQFEPCDDALEIDLSGIHYQVRTLCVGTQRP